MATFKSKPAQIGTARWVLNEREQAQTFIEQETEEFSFAAKNDMEWLNEHMAEIFNRNQLHVADVFKTPGKLRGKTPRTARKRGPLESRAPLTDIFAPNTQNTKSPSHTTGFYKNVAKIQDNKATAQSGLRISSNRQPHVPAAGKENVDSGYHGMPEDEMDIDRTLKAMPNEHSDLKLPSSSSPPPHHSTPQWQPDGHAEDRKTSAESFVSANEVFGSKAVSAGNIHDDDEVTVPDDEMIIDEPPSQATADETDTAQDTIIITRRPDGIEDPDDNPKHPIQTATEMQDLEQAGDRMEVDEAQSPSETSSPEKTLLRKSSLTFASLPAREPLTKMSVGNRTSHFEQHRTTGVRPSSQIGNWNGTRSIGDSQYAQANNHVETVDGMDIDEDNGPSRNDQNSESTKKHNENATQRLHERITMLGQSKGPRASKSIPSMAAASQNMLSQATNPETGADPNMTSVNAQSGSAQFVEDDDDDWIAPIDPHQHTKASQRPQLAKSSSTDVMEKISGKATIGDFDQHRVTRSATAERPRTSPAKTNDSSYKTFATTTANGIASDRPMTSENMSKKTGSVSYPDLASAAGFVESTTPAGSPASKRNPDGPLSASKAKLYSVLRSAKGIFASSAGVSAQAKMETLPPSANRLKKMAQPPPIDQIFPRSTAEQMSMTRQPSDSPSKANEGRKTRSSSEREEKKKEKEAKEKRLRDEQLAKVREKESVKATTQKHQRVAKEERTQAAVTATKAADVETDVISEQQDTMPPPAVPKTNVPASHSQKPRRPMKPSKDPVPKVQPAPVSIRLPSQSKKIGQTSSTSAGQSSLQDSFSSSQSKQSGPIPKPSNSSLQSSTSTNNLKSSTSAPSKPSSLQAAARKKELEEKAAQRKAEQKRELERKRAAKQEEERRQEQQRKAEEQQRKVEEQQRRIEEQQRKAAEQQRMQEAREAAQRKAMEQRRLEQQRLEQQRAQMLAKQKQATDLASKLQQEKAQAQAQAATRADLGAARPISRMNTIQDQMRPIPHPPMNPAKPPKRPKPDDEDEEKTRPAAQRAGPSYQQMDAKRRKTDEEYEEEQSEQRHSVKAPPIRNSNIRKDQQKFPHGYTNAPAPNVHPPSMFRTTVTAQHQMQQSKASGHPNEMAKFSSAKIPFAEVPNPPAGPSYTNNQNYKTPARGSQTQNVMGSTTTTTKVPLKSSPQYTPGENIALPDINTDSEDSDASTSPDFRPPSWANSPALRELLTQQQMMDPEQIFGPVAPLQMEEVFKNKERHKRFRDRTSSANWTGQDRLTEEDKRKDREGRERVVRDGGWTFTGPR